VDYTKGGNNPVLMKKIICFLVLLSAAALVFIPAQVADEIEILLDTEVISYGQAARFILQAADISGIDDSSLFLTREKAFNIARERRWLPKRAEIDAPARLDGISLLLMRSFGLRGGIFYSLFRNPHYAYREMVYREIIYGRIDAKMTMSGDMLLYMVNRVFAAQEQGKITAVRGR